MENLINILNLFNATAPGIANLVLLIRNQDGTVNILTMLDTADANYDRNMQQLKEWYEKKRLPQ